MYIKDVFAFGGVGRGRVSFVSSRCDLPILACLFSSVRAERCAACGEGVENNCRATERRPFESSSSRERPKERESPSERDGSVP